MSLHILKQQILYSSVTDTVNTKNNILKIEENFCTAQLFLVLSLVKSSNDTNCYLCLGLEGNHTKMLLSSNINLIIVKNAALPKLQ